MKNLMLNHNKTISAIEYYCEISLFATTEVNLNKPITPDSLYPTCYEGKIRINVEEQAVIYVFFKKDKTISFQVQGRDVELGETVVKTIINMVKKG